MIHLPLTLWTAWLAVLLAARSGLVRFPPSVPPLGIRNYCSWIGYPKAQDYFWFVAAVASGFIAVFLADRLRKIAASRGWCGASRGFPLVLGTVCLALAAALAFSREPFHWGLAPVLVAAGGILPWFDRYWYTVSGAMNSPQWRPPGARWIVAGGLLSLGVSVLCIADPCLPIIPIDGYHEGHQLLQVQMSLSDGFSPARARSVYGPLYDWSLIGWLGAFGLTVSAERWYFLVVQTGGCAIQLFFLALSCRGLVTAVMGGWLMLALSTVTFAGYGWANSLRTALPLAAVWVFWEGRRTRMLPLMALSGLLAASGVLYSREFGLVALVSCAAIAVAGKRPAMVTTTVWGAFLLAGLAFWLGLIFGPELLPALQSMLQGDYVVGRLLGHGVLPLPRFPWWPGPAGMLTEGRTILVLSALWFPGMACTGIACWLALAWHRLDERRHLALALAVFTMLVQVPVLARPMGQIGASMPPTVLLVAIWLDMLSVSRPVRIAVAAVLMIFAAAVVYPDFSIVFRQRLACLSGLGLPSGTGTRLGSVFIASERTAEKTARAVMMITRHCRPGEPVYMAAPSWAHLAFLADRPGMVPIPSAAQAVTENDRRTNLESLERRPPSVALLTELGVDVPFAWEHPEEWAWIRKHYRLKARLDDLMIYVRR